MFKEEKIASYTAPEIRIQLLKITEWEYESGSPVFKENPELNKEKIKYQIRINRKIVYTTQWENIARQQLYTKIKDHLFQLSLL